MTPPRCCTTPSSAYLRLGLRTVLVLALVVAGGAFVTGTSVTAVRTRQNSAHAVGWLRGGAESAGLRTGPVGTWVYPNKQLLRIGAVTLAALTLVFWGRPTGKTILVLAGLLLVALALIEFSDGHPNTLALPAARWSSRSGRGASPAAYWMSPGALPGLRSRLRSHLAPPVRRTRSGTPPTSRSPFLRWAGAGGAASRWLALIRSARCSSRDRSSASMRSIWSSVAAGRS